jgi:ketosteroid isomerase-like protein
MHAGRGPSGSRPFLIASTGLIRYRSCHTRWNRRFGVLTRLSEKGDIDGYLNACTDDFTFNVPGRSGISGIWVGRQGLYGLAGKVMTITGGTFREDVEDVLANDRHAVVLARHRFTRDGVSKDYLTAHVYEVRDGKLAACFEQARDGDSFHDAWGS